MPGGYALDLSADIDWANALPPHLLPPPAPPQPESHRVNSHNPTMIFNWPLPEDHPALQVPRHPPRRELRAAPTVEPLEVMARGSRRELMRMRDEQVHREWTEDPQGRRQQQSVARLPRRSREEPRATGAVTPPQASRRPEATQPRGSPSIAGRDRSALYEELLEAQLQMQREGEADILLPQVAHSARTSTPPQPGAASISSETRTPPPPSVHPLPASPQPGSRQPAIPAAASPGAMRSPAPAATSHPPAAGRRRPQPTQTGAGGAGGGQWELQDFSYESLLELGTMAVSTGLDKKQLERLRPVPYQGCKGSKFRTAEGRPPSSSCQQVRLEECSVCIEEVLLGSPSLELGCGHTFHFNCIVPWLARTNRCPTCRFEVLRR